MKERKKLFYGIICIVFLAVYLYAVWHYILIPIVSAIFSSVKWFLSLGFPIIEWLKIAGSTMLVFLIIKLIIDWDKHLAVIRLFIKRRPK